MPELLTNKSIISDKSADNELGIVPMGKQSVCWGQGLRSGLRVCLYLPWMGQLLLTPLVTHASASSAPGYCRRGRRMGGWVGGWSSSPLKLSAGGGIFSHSPVSASPLSLPAVRPYVGHASGGGTGGALGACTV